ncbi:sporulation membrane protein YtrI [Cytobacillus praedii]|uniref:Sporulation protein n=1 Tax=Cytobacillus praedii TaxID=1742358 RepID=A0A4R1ATR8_9BACI|nr:sporulation membrane protein YtrI [Cytobacillus praedii]MED3549301.1 sporulation protein [Cytobacillus praedii]MED3570823.1 sporulation protein [Cytobacillus praedii]TCJ03653.1 sporulation protein [Cytobacillus praedii]
MRIPPHYRHPVWQRFLAGIAIGGMISWFVFLYIFGEWQEKYSKEIKNQEDEIAELKKEKEIWQEEFKALNKKNRELLTIQDIKVKIGNSEKYKLDSFSMFEIEEQIKEDILNMKAKDIDTVYKSRELIERIIENKTIKVNEKRYKLEVKKMVIYTTLFIQLDIMLD